MTSNTDTVSYADLYNDIKDVERELAYGGNTAMWGDFVNRMSELGLDVHDPADQTIDADEGYWWRKAYDMLKANPSVDDLQYEIYDRI